MAAEQLSEELRRFIRERLETYEELEALLRLHRNPEATWSAETVAAELAVPVEAAAKALERLCAQGLLESQNFDQQRTFKFATNHAVQLAVVAELARAYDERRVEVMKLMNKNAIDRLRTGAIRMFADSFVWKKGKKDG